MNFITYRKSDLYDRVVEEYDVFENSYDFMVFLAVLGYREGRADRTNFEGSKSDETQGQIGAENFFANDLYRVIASSLAFQDTGDPAALVNSEKQGETLAQYAAGGLEAAEEEFGQTAGDPTDAIVNLIQSQEADPEPYQGTLGEIVQAFDDQMMGIEQDGDGG
jgi:dnd system-associated protein 4